MDRPSASFLTRIKVALSLGVISGIGQVIIMMIHTTFLLIYSWIFPEADIDIAEDFNNQQYIKNPERWGNHIYNVKDTKTDELKSSRFKINRENEDADKNSSSSLLRPAPRKTSLGT